MLKTLSRCIGRYRRASVLTPVFTALEVFMEILITFVTAAIIDRGIEAGDMQKILIYGAVMLACAFLSLLFGVQASKYGATASSGFACNLRDGMYANVQRFSFSNIDKFSTAGLVTRMTTDVTNVQNAYLMILRFAVRAPLTLICSVAMCFAINARLSLIFFAALIFLAAVLISVMRRTMPLFTEVFARCDELNAGVQENVSAIRVVKAFVREKYENEKFAAAAEKLCALYVRAEGILAVNNLVMMLVIYGGIIALS